MTPRWVCAGLVGHPTDPPAGCGHEWEEAGAPEGCPACGAGEFWVHRVAAPRWVPVTADRRGPVVPAGHRWAARYDDGEIRTVGVWRGGSRPHQKWSHRVTHICDLGTDPEAEVPAFVEARDLPPEVDALLARIEGACRKAAEPGADSLGIATWFWEAMPGRGWLEGAEAVRKMRGGE